MSAVSRCPPTHLAGPPSFLPLCGETEDPIYVSDDEPLNPNGSVTCRACLRLDALEDAADLVMKAAHNAAHEGMARCLREVAAKIREMK